MKTWTVKLRLCDGSRPPLVYRTGGGFLMGGNVSQIYIRFYIISKSVDEKRRKSKCGEVLKNGAFQRELIRDEKRRKLD